MRYTIGREPHQTPTNSMLGTAAYSSIKYFPVSLPVKGQLDLKLNKAGGTITGEIISTASSNYRITQGGYGIFFRNDGTTFDILQTASGDQNGNPTAARPFSLNLSTGKGDINGNSDTTNKLKVAVQINGTDFDGSGDITTSKWGASRNITINGSTKEVDGSGNTEWTLEELGLVEEAPEDNKNYVRKDKLWVESAASNVFQLSYADRNNLRSLDVEGIAVVEGLGLFSWSASSSEPDDDESCFATAGGRWILESPSLDIIHDFYLSFFDGIQAEVSKHSDFLSSNILTGEDICTITSLASVASASFTISVPGAAVGDNVIVTPPAPLGATSDPLSRVTYYSYIVTPDTVTVLLLNPSAASATINSAAQALWYATVIKKVK